MSGYPILRLKSYCAQSTQLNPSNLEYHVYPFTTLTSVKSHIHPRFVIYNTGRVLRNRLSEIFELGRSLGDSDWHGLQNPCGLRVGYDGVGVRVGLCQPSMYPYPRQGLR